MRGIVISFLLFFSLSAQGQFIIDSYRFGGAAGPINNPLLDSFPSAHSAYSLRLLRTAYTGDAIVVRRANNDTLSIGFASGYLDTAAMKTFCGTGGSDSCTVRRWFDQSGNARNVAQTTTANQPTIMRAGAIVYYEGVVAIDFDGTNDVLTAATATDWNFLHQSGIYFNFGVSKAGNVADPNAVYNIWGNTTSVVNRGAVFNFDDRSSASRNNGFTFAMALTAGNLVNSPNNIVTPNVLFLHTVYTDANNATAAEKNGIAVNGGSYSKLNTGTSNAFTTNATYPLSFGSNRNSSGVFELFLTGQIFEQIFYASDQSSNRAAIETNINNFYSIY
jgi:hypothetical protein